LADLATNDLAQDERGELEHRLSEDSGLRADADAFERAAAVLCAAGAAPEPLPAELRARIAASAAAHLQPGAPTTRTAPEPARPNAEPARAPRLIAWSGWALAAALLAMLVAVRADRGGAPDVVVPPGPAELRTALLEQADDLVRVAWTSTGDAFAPSVDGDVVWSPARQEGYMVFRGLPNLDPTEHQLQLWIVDAERDEPQPIDGGVFDAVATNGELVVPIDAKLPVGRAAAFLVTVEEPGGVVVSAAEHVVASAEVP